MRIGICLSLLNDKTDPAGLRWLETADSCGFDYVELPVAQMMMLDDDAFAALSERLAKARMRCECTNNLFPASVRLTGETVSRDAIKSYLDRAFPRLGALGVEVAVFGSSGAKNVPDGFSMDAAFDQIVDASRLAADYCREYGVRIAIEPLNKSESNIILNLTDGAKLMRAVDRPEVRLLVDYYHHFLENESPSVVKEWGGDLIHAHFAEPEGRSMPTGAKKEYDGFFSLLREAGYDGRVSLEAFSSNPEAEMKRALDIMRAAVPAG